MILARRRKRDSFLPWLQLLVDLVCIYTLLWAVFWFRFQSHLFGASLGEADHRMYFKSFHLVVIVLLFFLRSYGLYHATKVFTLAGEKKKDGPFSE